MKALVLKTFIDKNTGKQCLAGEAIECAVERGQFLAEKGFVKVVGEIKKEPVEAETKKEDKPKTTKPAPKKTTSKKKN